MSVYELLSSIFVGNAEVGEEKLLFNKKDQSLAIDLFLLYTDEVNIMTIIRCC